MTTYPVLADWVEKAYINEEQYHALYQYAKDNPEEFWSEQARNLLTWSRPWEKTLQGSFETYDVRWFTKGQLNACYNCLDRHLITKADQIALIWEGNEPSQHQFITYKLLHQKVCRFANALKEEGVKKGDRVCIYLPMIPEAVIAMLACARIGAIHSVVFGGFSSEALKTRILDADCRVLITADGSQRGDKLVALKENTRLALLDCPDVRRVIVVRHANNPVAWDHDRDVWYHDIIETVSDDCPIEQMDANDPLFILYTSGSTGKPKGVLHSTGGYLVYTALTFRVVFDYHAKEVYWCTADIGWITGHSYLVYGPLLNGATTLLFEGTPSYPTHARYWNIIDKHHVNIFYTAPTALRALRREGDAYVHEASRTSLRLLGSVGEPINPEVWQWYYDVVGDARCPIVNTWWQTETGGILLTPLPGATPQVAGSAGWPFLGIEFAIVNEEGQSVTGTTPGQLVIKKPWPGLMQSIYGDDARFQTYFNTIPGYYFTGDGAHCDEENCLWITGRNDDVIKVSGHRLGTEELESALVSHSTVSEAAVVGMAHDIKGETIVAFVTLKTDVKPSQELKQMLIQHVRHHIGALAVIEHVQWTNALPKTRSGKIMRRILRNIANHKLDNIGDLSTLAEPSVVEEIIKAFNHVTS